MIDVFNDEEFKSLDIDKQKSIAKNYFDSEMADDEFRSLPEEKKKKIYDNFFSSEVSDKKISAESSDFIVDKKEGKLVPKQEAGTVVSEDNTTTAEVPLDFENIDIDTLKQEVSKEEFDTRKAKVMSMPESTPEEKLLKKKAYIALNDNKENLGFFDKQYLATQSTLMGMARVPIGAAEVSEDIANLFRDNQDSTIEEFRKNWTSKINEINQKLGFEKDAVITPSLGGQIAGEISGVGAATKVLKPISVAATAATEAVMSFMSEMGTSGDYSNAATSGALAGSITGLVGRWVEGRPLDKVTKQALNEASPEELTNIANIYEFAKNNDIKIVDAMLSNNPDKVAQKLKSFGAPEEMVNYAESLRSDTGKKLLDAFNGALKEVKPDDIEDISLKKLAGMIQGESQSLKKELDTAKNAAYTAMKESPLKDTKVSTREILDLGLSKLDEMRADGSIVNAFKRNVLKKASTMDTESGTVAKEIRRLEEKIAKNEDRLAGFEVSGIDTTTLQNTIDKDVAHLDELSSKIDVDKLSDVTLEDMVGIVQDMNELKYSGSSHIATKGAKEQKIFNDINNALLKKIEDTSPEFHGLAKDASDKARDIFSLFGKQGRGTREFPELEVIRMSNNPDDIAKKIFSANASETGYKIEQTLEILGKRNPKLQKAVMGRYVNDAIGGFDSFVKGENTIKRSVLDMKKSTKAIDNLIGSPDSKRLTESIIGKDNTETLFNLNNFVKQHSEALDAMATPAEKKEAGILSKPVLKQISQLYNYAVYKVGNTGILKDEFHSTKYQKQVNKYVAMKLEEFNNSGKTKVDWNKLAYSLSGSSIEKYLTGSATASVNESNKEKLIKIEESTKKKVEIQPTEQTDIKSVNIDIQEEQNTTNTKQKESEVIWGDIILPQSGRKVKHESKIVWGNEGSLSSGGRANLGTFTNKLTRVESRSNYYAVNKKTGAYGKYQFMPDTLKEYASKTGQTIAQAKTPSGQDRMFERFTKDNKKKLERMGVPPTELNLWIAHNQGAGGAYQILKSKKMTPRLREAIAANIPEGVRPTINNYVYHWSKTFNG